MSVHEIKRTPLTDTPKRLRELADSIEGRKDVEGVVTIVCMADGYVAVRGYGHRMTSLEATGWLHRALGALTENAWIEADFTPKDAG